MPRPTSAVAVLLVTTLLAGCSDDLFADDPRQQEKTGVLVGGLFGATAGALAGGGREAVVGAAVGAVAGGLIGNQLDKQEAELRKEIGDTGILIENTGSELIVTMPQDILFDVDSTFVRDELRDELVVLADNLQRYPDSSVRVTGHTDNSGAASYNQSLSQRRAQAVSGILMANGVDPTRVTPIGAGEDSPIASNLTDEGRAQNRRVEIVVTPNSA